ncbi:baseplate wedge subunit [Vibrio phage D479]
MSDNYNLPVASGSFETIKQDLIQYMNSQTEFKDYDFTGSRLNVLVDLLAYNTMYMQHYSNAALMEGFIRTAQRHSSVVQHAQDMGYNPSSISASTNTIGITAYHAANPTEITLPTGTRFSADVDQLTYYPFVTWDPHILIGVREDPLDPLSPMVYRGNISLVQGTLGRYETAFDSTQSIQIKDPDLDRQFVRVFVDAQEWTNWTDKSIVNTNGGSNVFYLRETVDGHTEVYFGEGATTDFVESGNAYDPQYIGGAKPVNGQNVVVQYVKTSGPLANGSRRFTFADDIENFVLDDANISDNPNNDANFTGSLGGGYPEGTERIRELAQIYRESQRRCVTKLDYETFVSQRYGNIVQAIQAYGDSERPGYVFISIKPKSGLTLPQVVREDIEAYLQEFNIVTVTPKVVDPEYLYIRHNLRVNYRIGSLSEGADYLKSAITAAISEYYSREVEIFEASYHTSRMLSFVDASHASILGSRCDISLIREIETFSQTPMAGTSFLNPIQERSLTTGNMLYLTKDYNVQLKSTARRGGETTADVGWLVLGPFAPGDVTNATDPETGEPTGPYTGDDFDRVPDGNRTEYYRVGTINYVTGMMDYNFGVLGINTEEWDSVGSGYVTFEVSPVRTNVYTSGGSLIVYENDLRPDYTTIVLEGIS